MAKKIVAVLAGVIIILLIVITMQATAFTIERRVTINAPADVIFTHVNDFHRWAAWSPWEKMDADLKKTYSGPESGVGAHYEWDGEKTGSGNMTIKEAKADRTAIELNFVKPFAATNEAVFTVKPLGAENEVTWSMTGQRNFMAKAAGLVMDMDKLVGGDFEKGLADLKKAAEATVAAAAAAAAKPVEAVAPSDAAPVADAGTP